MTEDLRFPIGEFQAPEAVTPEMRAAAIGEIERMPAELAAATHGMSDAQLDTRYRPEGWTARQVVHHLADSHMNSYIRFKWAVTEDKPTIKAYDQDRWGNLADGRDGAVDLSLDLLAALHRRWGVFLRSLDEAAWRRKFNHPEGGILRLDFVVLFYAWHGRHHIAHITKLKEREGW